MRAVTICDRKSRHVSETNWLGAYKFLGKVQAASSASRPLTTTLSSSIDKFSQQIWSP